MRIVLTRVVGITPARASATAAAAVRRQPQGSTWAAELRKRHSASASKHAGDAGVMTACYCPPRSLAPSGWRCRTKVWRETAPEGVPRASPRSRGSAVDAPQGHRAPRRSRARTGATPLRPLRCGARESARPDDESGVADGNGPWREVSLRDGGAIRRRAPAGATQGAGAPNGWRDRCRETRRGRRMRRQGNTRRRASRSNAGPHRPRRGAADRPAKLIRTPARPVDAAPGAAASALYPPLDVRAASRRGSVQHQHGSQESDERGIRGTRLA